ncbi:tRNA threonylcarbamoyladenosine dehydratase [Caloramator australicus]|uniref:HesA/MoeB/ThiF family protein related to EC-YgdL n=1 Tax=Caloramator australicus RC3 TaxID=857293 RepID=I7LKS2_9CLOT|nr:tRNA threonylcarbamoyladenosine dehydratase [Caloramator australicus]CCJ34675.1 HesA/MoeB/ThiF family protein related to EC-YgdL [Caloramator australicus RC3]
MLGPFSRTELLLGKEGVEKLKKSTVAVFGVGGVGSFAVEALARSGVGRLILVDDDDVCITNINRQLHATTKTVGKPKVDVMAERVKEINPKAVVLPIKEFISKDNIEKLLTNDIDYVIDAIDTVSSKIELVVKCNEMNIPIISSMGAGNKLDPTKFEVEDIYKTSVCPLAKVMRTELRKRGIKKLKVVYSKEPPMKPKLDEVVSCKVGCVCPPGATRKCTDRRQIPGSISFVPSVVGLIMAGEVIKDIVFGENK